jgi:hydroxymethylglutaryl-CoA reductase
MITGFSKLSKNEKIDFISKNILNNDLEVSNILNNFCHRDEKTQRTLEEFSENTISNFHFPYGVVPNFKINGKTLMVPIVIEESSVVAALSKSAKFWSTRGGFHAQVVDTKKVGQVHFTWSGDTEKLNDYFKNRKAQFIKHAMQFTKSMEKRGGGLLDIVLKDFTHLESDYYQLFVTFETCDAMGANFINTVLEELGKFLENDIATYELFEKSQREAQVIMCILSNLTPECKVKAWVECSINELNDKGHGISNEEFASKFARAIRIAKIDPYRATTHNKGIFNGVDGVVLATGNDFRAVEACGHAYASRNGSYQSLTDIYIDEKRGMFRFEIEFPLSLGTVGGLTSLHPLAKLSLNLLDNPSSKELMMITAAVGLAQNFAAIRSLVTNGIQKGHMKMHLMNILNQLEATNEEKEYVKSEYENRVVSFNDVKNTLFSFRTHH